MPTKLAIAPTSVRPFASAAHSAPQSNSPRWIRMVAMGSATRHRRKERNLLRTRDAGVRPHVGLVEGSPHRQRLLEGVGVTLPTTREPDHEVVHRRHALRQIELFLALADALPHPCEIQQSHASVTADMVV